MIKFLIAVAGLLLMNSCQTSSPINNDQMICSEPRRVLCAMNYQPVCATDKYKGVKTFSNACVACSNKLFIHYINGKCSDSL